MRGEAARSLKQDRGVEDVEVFGRCRWTQIAQAIVVARSVAPNTAARGTNSMMPLATSTTPVT